MHRSRLTLLTVLLAAMALVPTAPTAFGQANACVDGTYSEVLLPKSPDEEGSAVEDQLGDVTEKHGYVFELTEPGAAFVYVGDQWYDLDLALFGRGDCAVRAQWYVSAVAGTSARGNRVIQLVRPDEQIIQDLPSGEYLLTVSHKWADFPQNATDFDPGRGFTVRIAVGPPVCGLDPANTQESDRYPGIMVRPDSALYQVGLTYDPPVPGPFDLMTFTAFLSPPYTDLFEFAWEIDGGVVPGVTERTLQRPASALKGQHAIRATARQVLDYPDPDTPPESRRLAQPLSVECQFWGPS